MAIAALLLILYTCPYSTAQRSGSGSCNENSACLMFELQTGVCAFTGVGNTVGIAIQSSQGYISEYNFNSKDIYYYNTVHVRRYVLDVLR